MTNAQIEGTRPVQVIEQTSKRLKAHILVAWAMLIVGLVGIFNSRGPAPGIEPSGEYIIAALMVLVAPPYWLVTRIRIWWSHK